MLSGVNGMKTTAKIYSWREKPKCLTLIKLLENKIYYINTIGVLSSVWGNPGYHCLSGRYLVFSLFILSDIYILLSFTQYKWLHTIGRRSVRLRSGMLGDKIESWQQSETRHSLWPMKHHTNTSVTSLLGLIYCTKHFFFISTIIWFNKLYIWSVNFVLVENSSVIIEI